MYNELYLPIKEHVYLQGTWHYIGRKISLLLFFYLSRTIVDNLNILFIKMRATLKVVHREIDDAISLENNCCKIGCAFCCYQIVEILSPECQPISDAIEKLNIAQKQIILFNLNKFWDIYNNHTPNNRTLTGFDALLSFQKMKNKLKIPCPLLIENKCVIYLERPITCRAHIVEYKPKICNKNPYRDSSKKSQDIRYRAIQRL